MPERSAEAPQVSSVDDDHPPLAVNGERAREQPKRDGSPLQASFTVAVVVW